MEPEKADHVGLRRQLSANLSTRYVDQAGLLVPPEGLQLRQAFVFMTCHDVQGVQENVFQTDREFRWRELAPAWEDMGMMLRQGPIRDYL